MLLQSLPISTLNLADDSFRISFGESLDALVDSIKEVGVVQPIITRHTVDGTYQIVAGYRRVLAAQELLRQTIPAIVHEHTDLPVFQAFLYNLHDNLSTRRLNLLEMATVVEKLTTVFGRPEDELVKDYLPKMGADASYKTLHQLLAITQCSTDMKAQIVDRGYALSTAARIAEFSPSTQAALLNVLRPLRATTSKLNELLLMIREISARDAITVEEVLNQYQLLTVVADPSVAPPAKVLALRQTLRGVRFPTLVQRQEQFANLLQRLQLPGKAKLTADPYFEEPKLKLECQFEDEGDLQELVQHLQRAFEQNSWQKIFEWYRA